MSTSRNAELKFYDYAGYRFALTPEDYENMGKGSEFVHSSILLPLLFKKSVLDPVRVEPKPSDNVRIIPVLMKGESINSAEFLPKSQNQQNQSYSMFLFPLPGFYEDQQQQIPSIEVEHKNNSPKR